MIAMDREIRRLRPAAETLQRLAANFPAAERNAYMILRHIEMLEMEIGDVVTALDLDARENAEE